LNTFTKVALLTALAGALYLGFRKGLSKVNELTQNLKVTIAGILPPSISQGILSIPVNVRIENPSSLSAPITNVQVFLSLLRNGMFVPFGVTDPSGAFTIRPGAQNILLYPRLDLSKLNPFGGNWIENLNRIGGTLNNTQQLITIKADVIINIQGFEFRTEQRKEVKLNDILRAAA
jgi:hypothetical protein